MPRALRGRARTLYLGDSAERTVLLPAILAGLAIALGTGLLIVELRSRALAEAGKGLRGTALVLAHQAERTLQTVDLVQTGMLERLKGLETAEAYRQNAISRELHDELRARSRGLQQIEALTLIDAEGNPLVSSRSWPVPDVSVADRDYFRALATDPQRSSFIGEPVRNRTTGNWTVFVARRITGPDGDFLGVIMAALNLGYLESLYGQVTTTTGSAVTLLRQDGTMLARYPRVEPNKGQYLETVTMLQQIAATGSNEYLGLRVSSVDGQNKLTVMRLLPSITLAILVTVPVDQVLASWREQRAYLLATACLLEAMLFGAVILVMRQMRSQRLLDEANTELTQAWERLIAQDQLRTQDARFGAALDNMTQALAMFDAENRLVVANPKFLTLFSLPSLPAILGLHFHDLIDRAAEMGWADTDEATATKAGVSAHVAGGKPVAYVRELNDGRSLAVCLSPLAEGGWLVTYEDITERRQAEARIIHMAQHDALTGLPNRVLFQERLQDALVRSQRGASFAVLCIDLDHFKLVNDSLGHPIGDALLCAVTDRLRQNVRATDTVARLGGDEFAVIQAGLAQPSDATELSRRLIEVLGAPYLIEGHSLTVGTSIGIAMIPGDGADATTLLKNADLALYRAKADGRGTFRFFEPHMDARMQARRALEVDLRQALVSGQFEMFYQPVMDLASRTVSGFEGLIRWRHPERGLVSPDAFIPLAEEIGMIVPIGEWVLRQACTDAMTWPGALKVAVNLSSIQFAGRGPVPGVAAALVASGLPPGRLELEITETVMLDDTAATLETLRALKALGVTIAMDDFGTGYSSLSYLRKFPFDRVKIDKSFITDLGDCEDSVAIVQAVTALCQTLGMATTAEGVETEAQFEGLRNGSCTNVQGYLFSKPRPAHEVAELCRRLGPAPQEPALV